MNIKEFLESQNDQSKIEVKNSSGDVFEFSGWPEDLLEDNGVIGDLIDWSLHNSKAPSIGVSYASALQEVATVLGRDVRTIHNNYANLNLTVVGDTGCGKEQVTKNALAIRKNLTGLYKDEDKSFTSNCFGAISSLSDFPRKHIVHDEYGSSLKNVFSSSPNDKERELLMDLMSIDCTVRAQERCGGKVVDKPFVCFTGLTHVNDILSCSIKDMVGRGWTSRNLFLFSNEEVREANLSVKKAIPDSFKSWYEIINVRISELNGGEFCRDDSAKVGKQIVLRFSKDADNLFKEMDSGYKVKRAKELKDTPFYHIMPRVAELALRLSLIFELAKNPLSIEVSGESFAKASSLVKFLKEEEIRFWEFLLSDSK